MNKLVDPLAHLRSSARAADKYIERSGAPPAVQREALKLTREAERQMLERAFEHVRKGLSRAGLGKIAREQLRRIEKVMERDYGLYSKIRPLRDP